MSTQWIKVRIWAYSIALWFIAICIVGYNVALLYYNLRPIDNVVVYHSVVPVKSEFKVMEKLRFVSTLDLFEDSSLEFNDIVFCQNEYGEFERYSEQSSSRSHSDAMIGRVSIWPYLPGVAYPTRCCLESNIIVHDRLSVDRALRYDGCAEGQFFDIIQGDSPPICEEQ